jgi:hypothetical protein
LLPGKDLLHRAYVNYAGIGPQIALALRP